MTKKSFRERHGTIAPVTPSCYNRVHRNKHGNIRRGLRNAPTNQQTEAEGTQLSTAYNPSIYDFFFSVETSGRTGKRDPKALVLAHQKFNTCKPLELDALKSAALGWQKLTPPPTRHDNWQFSRQGTAIEYALLLPDRTFLCITIQGR